MARRASGVLTAQAPVFVPGGAVARMRVSTQGPGGDGFSPVRIVWYRIVSHGKPEAVDASAVPRPIAASRGGFWPQDLAQG